jgi:hypothetical protein
MSVRTSRFTIVFIWAMIPLTVFGGLPRVGCICADGQHKFFCQRHPWQEPGRPCNCCFAPSAATDNAARHRPWNRANEMTCCQAQRQERKPTAEGVAATRPCRPVLENAAFLGDSRTQVDVDRAFHAPSFLAFEPLPVVGRGLEVGAHRGHSLPLPDPLVRFGVMLI